MYLSKHLAHAYIHTVVMCHLQSDGKDDNMSYTRTASHPNLLHGQVQVLTYLHSCIHTYIRLYTFCIFLATVAVDFKINTYPFYFSMMMCSSVYV